MDKEYHHYSGRKSKKFWKRVNKLNERQGELYSLGVALQNLEEFVLILLDDAEKDKKD